MHRIRVLLTETYIKFLTQGKQPNITLHMTTVYWHVIPITLLKSTDVLEHCIASTSGLTED